MKDKYLADLKEIKEIMNRSSRFISLSGLSGVSAGFIALSGAYVMHKLVFERNNFLTFDRVNLSDTQQVDLLLVSFGTLVLSIFSVIFLTTYETRKRHLKVWDQQTKRILVNLAIPLLTGGLTCLTFLQNGFIGVLPPLTLIFYGLALINVSKFTLNEIRSLGILEIVLGIIALQWLSYGLIIWSIGFGLVHIVYGIIIKAKYRE